MRMKVAGLVILLSLVSWAASASGVGAFSAFRNSRSSCLLSIVEARELAMGGASLAIRGSVSRTIWEPGIHPILPNRVARVALVLGNDFTSRFAEATLTWGDVALGLGTSMVSSEFMVTDATGSPSGSFTWAESVIFASAVAQFEESGVLGVQLNSYRSDSGLGGSATGLGIDFGGAARVQGQGFITLRARDLGNTEIHWEHEDLETIDIVASIIECGLGANLRSKWQHATSAVD